MTKYDHPPITDEEVLSLMKDITVLSVDSHGIYRVLDIKGAHPSRQSFLWNATEGDPWVQPSDVELLTPEPLQMYHSYGAPSLFKPSLTEVIAQIPANLRREVRAFCLQPIDVHTMNRDALNAGYHTSFVTLFGVKEDDVEQVLLDQRDNGGCHRAARYTAL